MLMEVNILEIGIKTNKMGMGHSILREIMRRLKESGDKGRFHKF